MDLKVCGKLLTHHRRDYGVDVEALRDRFPLRQSIRKAPRWDLTATSFSTALVFPEEEGMMQKSSVSISLSF